MTAKVFVAEKETGLRLALYEDLLKAGITVSAVPSVSELIALLENDTPDLIILATSLAESADEAMVERIRRFAPETRLLFLLKEDRSPGLNQAELTIAEIDVIRLDLWTRDRIVAAVDHELPFREAGEETVKNCIVRIGPVLIVDDNGEERRLITDFLRKKGFKTLEADNGEAALRAVRDSRPSLILLDERMPGMDGLLVLKKIKETVPGSSVIMVTGVGEKDIIRESVELGADDFLTKPFDLQKLMDVLIKQMFLTKR
ncbi:MAG: response regulator [Deltaproteobacteria bacterium]